MPAKALEGELRVTLRVDGGRVAAVGIASTRPDIAATLLQGLPRERVVAMVPMIFAVCSRSQRAAARLALGAAAGEPVADLGALRGEVVAELLRETAWRLLIDGPHTIGEAAGAEAVAAVRAATAFDGSAGAAAAIGRAVFGVPAAQWLSQVDSPASLAGWLESGPTAAARVLRALRDGLDGDGSGVDAGDAGASLPSPPPPEALVALGERALADTDFARAPTWQGTVAETGALSRCGDDPLVAALAPRERPLARGVARLREFAELLGGTARLAVGALPLSGGRGIGYVENARGLLLHAVALDGGLAVRYRIVAPTEWNFHPQGALARSLVGTPAGGRDALHRRAERLVHSLDPCVECRVEIEDA